jgi:outer membrane receptor for ferrienterochelin and colicins
MIRIVACVLCTLTVLTAVPLSAQSSNGRISGTVTADGLPLIKANVLLEGSSLPGGRIGTLSEADGTFDFRRLAAGTYDVTATFIGYSRQTAVAIVNPDATTSVDLQLMADPFELDELVVSASRRAESLLEAPASISRIEAADIQRDAASAAYMGVVKNTKGIDHFQSSILEERVNARGFNSALSYRMLVLIDGRVTTTPSLGLPLNIQVPVTDNDIESVEVIVGPGSALYGPDATSGVISMTTKDPRQYPGTQVSLAGGTRSTVRGSFRHAGYQQKWAWKASGEYQQAHDYELVETYYSADSTASVIDDPDFDADVMRGQFGLYFDPSPDTRLALNVGGSITDALAVNSLGRAQVRDLGYHFEHLSYTTPQLYVGAYHTADDWGSTYMLPTKAQAMLAGLPKEAAVQRARIGGQSSLWEAEARYRFRLMPVLDTEFDVGANFRQFRPETDGRLLDDAARQIRLEQLGIYGQSRTDLSETLRLILAARLDDHETYGTKLSPKVALVYQLHADMAVRATYNQAYQSPSLGNQDILVRVSDLIVARGNGEGFQFANLTGGPLPARFVDGIAKLKPEENTTFELGFRGVLGNRISVDATGYLSRYRHFISPVTPINDLANGIVVLDDDGNPRREVTLTYLNFGKQTVNGLDVTANTYLTPGIGASVGLSLIEAGTLKGSTGFEQPFNTPEAIYTLGLSTRDLVATGVTADLALRHVTEFDFASGVYVGTVPAYSVVDLNLAYDRGHDVGVRLTAKNLLGNRHREFVGGPKIGRMIVTRLDYSL